MSYSSTLGKGTPVSNIKEIVIGTGAVSLTGNCPFCGSSLIMHHSRGICSVCRKPIKWIAPLGRCINLQE